MCSHIKCARIVFQSTPLHGTSNTCQLSDGITLLDAQRRRIAPVATEEQAPQIGRLAADNREQFRVRAQGPGKGLSAGRGSDSAQLGSRGDFLLLSARHGRRQNSLCETGYFPYSQLNHSCPMTSKKEKGSQEICTTLNTIQRILVYF